ncbi:FYVE, RhoGEF and PH domain-containing protein 6 [Balamuthia mandrillaris]
MSYVPLLALGTLVAAYPLYLLHIIVPILSRGIVGGPAFQSWHLFWARPAVRYALPPLCFLLLSPFFLLPASHEEDSLDSRAKAVAGEAEATTASTSFSPFRFFLGYVLCFYALRTLELLMARRKESVGEPVIFSSTLAFYAHCLLPTRVSPYQEGSTDSSKKTRRRYFIVKELLDTERAYVGNLSTFTRNYMGRLMELPAKEREKLASEQTIKEIFSNLEVILKVNEALLESLEQKMEAWAPNSILSDIFFKFTPFLKVYTTFSNNYSHGLATYIHQKKTNAKFAQWIEQTSRLPECDYYDFDFFFFLLLLLLLLLFILFLFLFYSHVPIPFFSFCCAFAHLK